MRRHAVGEIAPERRILLSSAYLPAIHNDPFDRVIVATAHARAG